MIIWASLYKVQVQTENYHSNLIKLAFSIVRIAFVCLMHLQFAEIIREIVIICAAPLNG